MAVPPLPERLTSARRAAKLTQAQVAAELGVQAPRVVEWEKGRHVPQPETRAKLAVLYGVPTESLEPDAAADGDPRDPAEHLPGYWRGYLAGVRRTMGRAMSDLTDVHRDLGTMIQAGHRWEAATVMAVAERVARETAARSGRDTSAADVISAMRHASETPIFEGDPPGMEPFVDDDEVQAPRERRRA
jgi:transcriptional regulator with XRE-family HTH domain